MKTVKEVLATGSSGKKKGGRKGGGSKKIGRNMAKCAKYKAQDRRGKNKLRKMAKNAKREAKDRRKI